MKLNLPVTQREYDYPGHEMLVSTTDTRGYITHCNKAFVNVSGYEHDQLIGQNHNLIRHPDMPPEGFKDLWQTIGRGKPWTGLVKNRRKNGDHYWVIANVTPIMQGKKPIAYLSVRTKPTRAQIQTAEALYAQVNRERETGRPTATLVAGHVRRLGWRGWLDGYKHLNSTQRLGCGLLLMTLLGLAPGLLGLSGMTQTGAQFLALSLGAGGILLWFKAHLVQAIEHANEFASDMASCNLTTQIDNHYPEPMYSLVRNLAQVQVNLRAVIGDVRSEVDGFSRSAQEIASGSTDLSHRTEAQATSLEKTASAMEKVSNTVRNTADAAQQVAQQSHHSSTVATRGQSMLKVVSQSMQEMERSSQKMSEIIGTIESIAFQTNILALNAAVEAARAGEQGRGFAVVASEVRALAQRSANAAKEIHTLIGQSVEQVNHSARQMNDTASTIDTLADEVRKMSSLADHISTATQEQSQGIAEVNIAVTQLDNVTHQNAALVEQSSAAAHQLSQGTDSLHRAVAIFRLP